MASGVAHDWEVGCEVILKTVADEEISGEVFAFDKNARIVVVKQPGTAPRTSTVRIITERYLASVMFGKRPENALDLRLPPVNLQVCKEREDKAVRAAEAEAARIGAGVSKIAQQMFDALAKTMPCRWDGPTIVVLEEVRLTDPYGPANCTTKMLQDTATMERVQKVLEAEQVGSKRPQL